MKLFSYEWKCGWRYITLFFGMKCWRYETTDQVWSCFQRYENNIRGMKQNMHIAKTLIGWKIWWWCLLFVLAETKNIREKQISFGMKKILRVWNKLYTYENLIWGYEKIKWKYENKFWHEFLQGMKNNFLVWNKFSFLKIANFEPYGSKISTVFSWCAILAS
jgi:hypothetical protein